MLLNCIWYSEHLGEHPNKDIEYRTKILFKGKYYYYTNEPEKVKSVWEAQEHFKWHQVKQEEGKTFFNVKIYLNKIQILWILMAAFFLITSILLMHIKSVRYGLTPILMFILCLYRIDKCEPKTDTVPDFDNAEVRKKGDP